MDIGLPVAALSVLCIPFICMTPIVLVFLAGMYWYSNREKRTIEVKAIATERRYAENGTLDIWTVEHESGVIEMLYNGPSLFNGKFLGKTVQIQQQFEVGAKYRLQVAGGRSFSQVGFFQNILSVEKLD